MSELPEGERGVYDLIEAVEVQLHPDRATLSRILAEADRLVESYADSPEAHYLRGWALYHLWDHGFGAAREALDEMRRVLRLDPSHQWALWDAVVLSARLDEDGAVIDAFMRLNRAFFTSQDKDWRYLKAWEYALCGHLRLGHRAEFEAGLRGLVREFRKVADDPDVILERPNQLMALYRELRSDPCDLASGVGRVALIDLLESQLALLVPGGWIGPQELGSAGSARESRPGS
ncbi:MAG: hypothetical protein ACRDP6_38930 [Actinoallomurus sp.]